VPEAADDDEPPFDVEALIHLLDRHHVEFLVVGGVAGRLHGASRVTKDADCLPDPDQSNMDRLADAMREVHARLSVEGLSDEEARALPIPLDGRWLADQELSTWRTDIGKIDVLMNMPARDGTRLTYADLAARAIEMRVADTTIHVAALGDIIASKEWCNRDKDHQALPELRALHNSAAAPETRPATIDTLVQTAYPTGPTRPSGPGTVQPTAHHDIGPPDHHLGR